jgi:hypothetical protein
MADNITNFVFSYLRDFYGVREEAVAGSDSLGFVEKIKRVHQGLSAEHEFAAIASWLGRCSLLTQLDSVLHVSERYRVPDFLVVVERQGKDVPFLVEIKTDSNDKLVWSQAYMASMRDFAALLKLPLLVAWKRHGLWVLTDSARFIKKVKSYHLTFDDAMKNSLMSELFGNFWVQFSEGFRLEVKMRIEDEIDASVEKLPEREYHAVIEAAGVWTHKGRIRAVDEEELWWFLVTAIERQENERVGGVITAQFVAKSQGIFNLSDVLVTRLQWGKEDQGEIDWLIEIRKGLPEPTAKLETILDRALELGAVSYVFKQAPQVYPEFLE